MKKTLLLLLSLAVLLTIGAFAVKAVTQSGFDTNSFNFSGANFNNYVQDDVYKYICKSGECVSVKQATLKPSDAYYNSKSDCVNKCGNNPANVNTSGSASGSFNFNFNGTYNAPAQSKPVANLNTGSNLNGVSFNAPTIKPSGTPAPSATGGIAPSTNFGGVNFKDTTVKTPGVAQSSLFGTDVKYNPSTSLTPQGGAAGEGNKVTFFGSLLQKFGITGAKTDTITPQDSKIPPKEDDNGEGEVTGDIAFTYSPEKIYGKGEAIKIKIIKPTNISAYDSFWYDLSVDWKNTPEDKSDDILKEANEITKSEFEIKTDGYYRIELTIKGFKAGKTQSLDKWTTSKTVVLEYNEVKKAGTETIKNDCWLDITGFKPSINNKIGFTADKPEAVTVDFKLNCTSYDAKYFDVRPISVSAYIDVPALRTIDKDIFACETKTISGDTIYKTTDTYTVTCSKEKVTEALKKESAEDTRNRFLMVDMYYMTNKHTNTHNGEAYSARFISTKDKISMPKPITNPGEPGDKPDDTKPSETDGREMKIEAIVTPGKDRTFETCKGGKVKVVWSSKGYDSCSISSDTLVYIDGSGKEGTKDFNVGKNTKDDVVSNKIKLICTYLKDNKPTKDEKIVQINTPECEGTQPPASEEQAGTIKEKCDKNKCSATFSLDDKAVLKMNDKKVLNASALKFGVNLSGTTCDLGIFQKTFARIKIDGKIVQDITIPANTKAREYTIGNVWTQLSEQTRKNIENTLAKYDGAKIKVELEAWSTFDETKGKTWNCNWSSISKEITFVKGGLKNNSGSGETELSSIEKCKKQCDDDANNPSISEKYLILMYGGKSKNEARQNCIAKCEGKPIPYPSDSNTETFKPVKSGGITSGTNVGMCATGYPKFVYGTLHTPDNSYGIAAVQIDYSGCCFKDLVRGYGVKYQNNPSSIKVTSLNSKGAVDTRAYFGTDSTGNVTYEANTTLCIGDAKKIGNSCERYCIYSNSNGKTTENCNFDTNYQNSCPTNYPIVEYGTLSNGGTCVKTDFSKCQIQGKGVTGSVILSDSPVGALEAYNKDKTYCLLTLTKVYSKTNITAWFYNQPQLHCEYTNIDGKLSRSCFNIHTCNMEQSDGTGGGGFN